MPPTPCSGTRGMAPLAAGGSSGSPFAAGVYSLKYPAPMPKDLYQLIPLFWRIIGEGEEILILGPRTLSGWGDGTRTTSPLRSSTKFVSSEGMATWQMRLATRAEKLG